MNGSRIKQRQNQTRIRTKEMLERLNVTAATLSRWKNNISEPNDETKALLAKILDTTVAYLMGGTTSPAPPSASSKTIKNECYETEIINVPVVNPVITACAGEGNGYYDVEWTAVAIRPIPVKELIGHLWQGNSNSLKIITIEDRSMEPKYRDGDQVLFIEGEPISSSDVVIAIWDDRLYIRGYFIESKEVVLRPRNPIAENIRVGKEDCRLQIVGKVIARVPQLELDSGFYS